MLRMMEPQLEEDFKPGQKKRQGSRELLEEQKMRHKLKQVRSLLVFTSSVKKIDNLAGHNVLVRYDFFADLNLTSGISLNSFYWFLCDVGARPISYFFQFWSFGGARGPETGSNGPQIAQNRHLVP